MEPWAQSPAPQKRHNPSTGKIETSRIEIQVQSQPLLRRNMSQHGLHGTLSQRKTKEEARKGIDKGGEIETEMKRK